MTTNDMIYASAIYTDTFVQPERRHPRRKRKAVCRVAPATIEHWKRGKERRKEQR